jgi:predicted alpha/beta superfamily hydrolase
VDTVKPLVDATFRTTGERDRTATIGSSMGGLVSLYAFFTRPDVFGLAGAFSPSIGFGRGAMVRFLRQAPRVPGRIYLDVGAKERMGPLVHEARNILIEKGYRTGNDLLFVEDDGGAHDEASWARRLPRALRFLLG